MRPDGGDVVQGPRLVPRAFDLRRVNRFGFAFSLLCFGTLALNPCLGADVPDKGARPSQPQLVLEQSILTRAIGIEAPDKLAGLLDTMPPGVVLRDAKSAKARAALWSLFFRGSMTKLARVPSPQPFILFYNPIADVAVIEGCKVDPVTRVMLCSQACAFPGEVLDGELVATSPSWRLSSDPFETLQRIASSRVRAFGTANPASSPETSFWRRSYCSAENQTASEKRLISLATISAKFDKKQFFEAMYHYLANSLRNTAAQHAGSTKPAPDSVVTLLTRRYAMAGAVQQATGSWSIFFTEKQNGWHTAALTASAGPNGKLKLENARFLKLTSKGA
jgi:hypothetical protein